MSPPSALSPDLQEVARKELGERPEWLERDIATLRSMVKEDGRIRCPLAETDDAFLLQFLRAKKFDHHKALATIRRYCQMRESLLDMREKMLPSALEEVYRDNVQHILPEPDREGRPIFVLMGGKWQPRVRGVDDPLRAFLMALEMLIREDVRAQVSGVVVLTSMEGFSVWDSVRYLNPSAMRRIVRMMQDCLPMRVKAFHCLRSPRVFPLLVAFARPFLSAKLVSRIHFHSDQTSLEKHGLPKSILPSEFGGDAGSFDNSDTVQKMLSMDHYFRELQEIGYNWKK